MAKANPVAEKLEFSSLTTIEDSFYSLIDSWLAPAQDIAEGLLWSLFAISLAFTALQWMLKKGDPLSNLLPLLSRLLVVGIVGYFILNFNNTIKVAADTFPTIAAKMSGTETVMSPLTYISKAYWEIGGFFVGKDYAWYDALIDLPAIMLNSFAMIIVVICFIYIAVEIIVTQIAFQFMLVVGLPFLGFSGLGLTQDYGFNYLRMLIAMGCRILVFYLIAAMASGGVATMKIAVDAYGEGTTVR